MSLDCGMSAERDRQAHAKEPRCRRASASRVSHRSAEWLDRECARLRSRLTNPLCWCGRENGHKGWHLKGGTA
jgi:hypothetical protein